MAVEDTWNKEGGYKMGLENTIYVFRSFMICTAHLILLGGQIKEDGMGGACGIWRRNKMRTSFWWLNLKKRDNLQDLGVDSSIILKFVQNTYSGRVWTGSIWLQRKVLRSYEHYNKRECSIQCK
jgi:hypothetical protein